jgi:hypothetical protein
MTRRPTDTSTWGRCERCLPRQRALMRGPRPEGRGAAGASRMGRASPSAAHRVVRGGSLMLGARSIRWTDTITRSRQRRRVSACSARARSLRVRFTGAPARVRTDAEGGTVAKKGRACPMRSDRGAGWDVQAARAKAMERRPACLAVRVWGARGVSGFVGNSPSENAQP